MLIHNTLLIYSYNIICFCFVIQLSMYVLLLTRFLGIKKAYTIISLIISLNQYASGILIKYMVRNNLSFADSPHIIS